METGKLREQLSALQHAIWSHWMNYLFKVCILNVDGSYTIPVDKVERWQKQMRMEYQFLSDEEKESDQEQADRVIHLLEEMK